MGKQGAKAEMSGADAECRCGAERRVLEGAAEQPCDCTIPDMHPGLRY